VIWCAGCPDEPRCVIRSAWRLIGDPWSRRERLRVAAGRGALGSAMPTTSATRKPRFLRNSPRQRSGEERRSSWNSSLLAEVGIIGPAQRRQKHLDSACFSSENRKLPTYPFTTLVPNLGVVAQAKWRWHRVRRHPRPDRLVLRWVPGLGHDFLRHNRATRLLVHLGGCRQP